MHTSKAGPLSTTIPRWVNRALWPLPCGRSSQTALRASFCPSYQLSERTLLARPSSGRGCVLGRGVRGVTAGSLMGRSVSHQNIPLRAHRLFMAIKRPNFLPKEGPRAQSAVARPGKEAWGHSPSRQRPGHLAASLVGMHRGQPSACWQMCASTK